MREVLKIASKNRITQLTSRGIHVFIYIDTGENVAVF